MPASIRRLMEFPVSLSNAVRNRRLRTIAAIFALFVIVLLGAYFRTVNLSEWDGRTGHHPDERFIHYTVVGLSVPEDWRSYFAVTCPTPFPAPRNPQEPPERWEPSAQSGCSTLNPRNFNWSRGYVYGTLPTTLTRLIVEALDRTDIHQVVVTGRALSTIADLITLLTTFALAKMLYGRRVGLLAAALYAGAVMPIQQSHFFTVDNFAVCFGTLALFFITRLGLRGRWYDAILSGLFISAAVASKINMAVQVGLVFVALLQIAWFTLRSQRRGEYDSHVASKIVPQVVRIGLLLMLTGLVSFVAFRIFQPDAFAGPSIWNIRPNQGFVDRLREARLTANGTVDLPSSHQWADRTPWLFPLQNMVLWGMGAPLGVAAWLGWAAAGWQLVARKQLRHLVPWLWVALYFGWQGQQFTLTLRYFLPIYPPLIMFAAWGLLRLWGLRANDWLWFGKTARWLRRPLVAASLLAGVVVLTWAWAWAYTRIYTRTYTRIAAIEWLQQTAPNGAINTWEEWDDPLPLGGLIGYDQVTTRPYAEEEPSKYLGRIDSASVQAAYVDGLIDQLAQSEYVALTSPRVYESVARVPQRFPALLRYYESLFDGSLGFELVGDFHSFPTLFGLEIPDLAAEEAFWVYDHPRVLIFQRTAAFNPERARQIIVEGIAWDEIYRGLRPVQMSQAPTALQLSASAWDKLQATDTRYLFTTSRMPIVDAILWLLAIEVLGVATVGIVWRLNLPLPDRGLSLARVVGLLLFAVPMALLAATQRVSVNRLLLVGWFGLLLLIGAGLLWRERRSLGGFVQSQRWMLGLTQVLYGGVLIVSGVLVSLVQPIFPERVVARWTALVRSPTLPPYDPFFAGGLDPLPYAARVPFALLDRLLGVLPTTALQLALPTALALTLLSLWSVLSAPLATRSQGDVGERAALSWLASLAGVFGALVLFVLGFQWGDRAQLSVWGILLNGNLDALALLAWSVSAAALGTTVFVRGAPFNRLLLVVLPLALIRGYGFVPLLAVLAVIAAFGCSRSRGTWRPWLMTSLGLLLGGVVLGQPLNWSLAAPALEPSPLVIPTAGLVFALLLPLLVLGYFAWCVGHHLVDRTMLLVAASVVGAWVLLAVGLNWSLSLLAVPPLMFWTWLAVQSWLPGCGMRHWSTGLPFTTAAIATALLIITGLVLAGRIGGDAPAYFVLAALLLVCAAGWTLPVLRRSTQARVQVLGGQRLGLLAGVGLVLLAIVAGLSIRGAATGSFPAPSADMQARNAVLRWIAATSTGAPVLVAAPTTSATSAQSIGGSPLLLTAVEDQRRLRDVVQPAVNPVIDGRQRAISAIYGGDVQQARKALETYQVQYVLRGPDEQAAFGESAGSVLEALAQLGVVQQVYEQQGVQLFQVMLPDGTPPFVVPPATISTPSIKTLMLRQPVDELPVVDEYAWNRLANTIPALGVGLWLLLIEVLGLLALPFASLAFQRWHDRGWGVSKIVGLLVWGYAVWLPVNLGWWLFSWRALLAGAVILGGISAVALWRLQGTFWTRLRYSRRAIVVSELCFLTAFGLWTLVRAANPDLWHPYLGGEKPFEFGFLNAILRSPVLPPYDPFFSDGIINYYYYGLFLVALPIKALGIDPAIGFNLVIPTLFALTAAVSLALGRQLSGRWRYGWLAVFLMLGTGPLASVVKITESRGLEPVLAALSEGLSGFSQRLGQWFWGPSRVIPYTINEFPLFGFLFADLHPHLIALPITLLALVCAVELGQRRQWLFGVLGLSAIVIGALAVANSWDAPTYALLIGGALVGRAWRINIGRVAPRVLTMRVLAAVLLALGVVASGLALYTPFFLHYRAMVGGVGVVRNSDRVIDYALLYGPFLFGGITLLGCIAWRIAQRAEARWSAVARGTAIALPLLVGMLLLSGWMQTQPAEEATRWSLRLLLAFLAAIGLILALVARLRDREWLPLWFFTVGLLVALGIQLIFIQDHLADSDWERMNTVFKFGLQLWTLWALAAVTGLPLIVRTIRRSEIGLGIWLGLWIILLLPGLVYPLVGIPSRLSTRFDPAQGLTLDGLAFLRGARYEHEGKQIDLSGDADAIAWLKQNIAGTPVFLTSEREFYRAYGMRIAANTGLPTVLGSLHQSEQRPAHQVTERERDVQTLYNTTDTNTTLRLLAKYHVDYVYVGPVERALYDLNGIAKWQQLPPSMLESVYKNDSVDIYRVKSEAFTGIVAEPRLPPITRDDPVAQALAEQVAANPGDGATAFSLAHRYIELNRLEEAVQVLETVSQSHPNDVALHHLLGDLQAQLGRADEAIAAWQRAVDAQPSAGNINKLGQGLIQLGRWDDAERTLNEVLRVDPAFAEAYFYLGELYRSRDADGDDDRAVAAYQRYLDTAPADAPWRSVAQERLAELGR